MNRMGSRIKFLFDFKTRDKMEMLVETTSREVIRNLFQVAKTSKFMQMAVYQVQCNMNTFAVQQDEETSTVGYALAGPKSTICSITLKTE
jgi:hypothetical protein